MAKVKKTDKAKASKSKTKPKKVTAPSSLTMRLHGPGMSAIHRAGLGGLAATLHNLKKTAEAGRIAAKDLPAPFENDLSPWVIDSHSITLNFGQPEHAEPFLKKLFAYAFQIQKKDGLIFLPGQFAANRVVSPAVLADLQLGLTLTFLQHGRVRNLAKESTTASYDPEGEGIPAVTVEYRKCSGFKHQEGWKNLVDKNGCLQSKLIGVEGPVSPGTVVRHVAFTGPTGVEDPVERMLPLYFALVGCLSLPVNRGVAALVVPEVTNLCNFIDDRQAMTPTTSLESHIANGADAALRTQLKLSAHAESRAHLKSTAIQGMRASDIPGCHVMTFMPTPWASQQKSRVATIYIQPQDQKSLERFEIALANLPPRVATRTVKESTGRGKKKVTTEHEEAFRVDSVVRPLIADNLALGRPWYAGFVRLMTKNNPATDKPFRNQLSFERKGLNDMISEQKLWDDEGEALVVKAVHEAISHTLGRIRMDTDGAGKSPLTQATKNRWDRFREKLRLDLAGAKTESQLRFAITDLFSRGGSNSVLREHWERVLPILQKDWQLTRDLGLLALASYAGKEKTESNEDV